MNTPCEAVAPEPGRSHHGRARYRVVAFDLDGTLLRGTTASLRFAEVLGVSDQFFGLERAFNRGEISHRTAAERVAALFAGMRSECMLSALEDAPWVGGMAEAFALLQANGIRLLLATSSWSFVAEWFGARHGFSAVSGSELTVHDGKLTGAMERYLDGEGKARFLRHWAEQNFHAMAEVVAIGDSHTDVPMFRSAGLSIALNATAEARAAADHALDTEDLRHALPLVLAEPLRDAS
jgi:phosphoserine phosphatase